MSQPGQAVQGPSEKISAPTNPAKPSTEQSVTPQAAPETPIVTSHGSAQRASQNSAIGILDRHMAELQNLPEQKQPEQEISM